MSVRGIVISRPGSAASRSTIASGDSLTTIPDTLCPSSVRIVTGRYSGRIVFDGSSNDSTRCSTSDGVAPLAGCVAPGEPFSTVRTSARFGPSGEGPVPAAGHLVQVRCCV